MWDSMIITAWDSVGNGSSALEFANVHYTEALKVMAEFDELGFTTDVLPFSVGQVAQDTQMIEEIRPQDGVARLVDWLISVRSNQKKEQ